MRLAALLALIVAAPAAAAAQGPAAIQAQLRAHDYERARAMALVHPWDLATEAGQREATETWLAFLAETHRRAMEHHRAERPGQAVELAVALIADPPLFTITGEAPLDAQHYWVCSDYCDPEYLPTEARVVVPVSRRTTQRLEDLALFLMAGGDGYGVGGADMSSRGVAQALLTAIVERHPDRASALYNLADLRWSNGNYDEAVEAYRRFARLRGARTPDRVRARIRQGGPPPRSGARDSIWRDDPDAELSSQSARGRLGTIAGGQVSYAASREEAGWGYWESSLTLAWRGGGRRHRTQVLEGIGNYLGSAPRIVNGLVEFTYGASGGAFTEDSGVTERWAWNADRHRFVRRSQSTRPAPYQAARERLHARLAAGDLEGARGAALISGVSGTGGHTDDSSDILDRFLVATHRIARRHARRAPEAAAQLCRLLFVDPPVTSVDDEPWATGRFRAYTACARWLAAGSGPSDREAALAGLRVQAAYEMAERAPDRLALADALHDLGDPATARGVYRGYVEVARRPVSRATERASD